MGVRLETSLARGPGGRSLRERRIRTDEHPDEQANLRGARESGWLFCWLFVVYVCMHCASCSACVLLFGGPIFFGSRMTTRSAFQAAAAAAAESVGEKDSAPAGGDDIRGMLNHLLEKVSSTSMALPALSESVQLLSANLSLSNARIDAIHTSMEDMNLRLRETTPVVSTHVPSSLDGLSVLPVLPVVANEPAPKKEHVLLRRHPLLSSRASSFQPLVPIPDFSWGEQVSGFHSPLTGGDEQVEGVASPYMPLKRTRLSPSPSPPPLIAGGAGKEEEEDASPSLAAWMRSFAADSSLCSAFKDFLAKDVKSRAAEDAPVPVTDGMPLRPRPRNPVAAPNPAKMSPDDADRQKAVFTTATINDPDNRDSLLTLITSLQNFAEAWEVNGDGGRFPFNWRSALGPTVLEHFRNLAKAQSPPLPPPSSDLDWLNLIYLHLDGSGLDLEKLISSNAPVFRLVPTGAPCMGTVKANLYAFADGYARLYQQSSAASRGKTSSRGVLIHAMLSGLPPHLQALTGSLLNIAAGPSSVKKHISFGVFVDAALTSINEIFTSSDTRDRADFSAASSRFLPVLKARVDALCTYCSKPKHTAEMCNKRKADERASAVSLDAWCSDAGARR